MTARVLAPPLSALGRQPDPDDLLALSLHDEADSAHDHRDWTGDLEDLVSIQVAQQLHSKRPQPVLAPYTPPGRSTSPTSIPAAVHSPSTPSSRFTPDRSPSQPGRRRPSGIPRAGAAGTSGNTKSRSVSPDVRRVDASPPSAAGEFGEQPGAGWETLQVGGAATAEGRGAVASLDGPVRNRRTSAAGHGAASTQSPQRSKTLDFPSSPAASPASLSGGAKTRAPRAPPLPASSSPTSVGGTATPRRRAATQSPSAATPSPSTLAARARRSPAPTTASPSTGAVAGGKPPPRRKSITTSTPSSSTRGARRSPSSDRLRAAARQAAEDDDAPALPPWSDSPAPLVYRTSQGELAFAYDEQAEGAKARRPEDRVLPAVARRLEAERVERMARERAEGVLVNEWSREGTPRRAVELAKEPRRAKERGQEPAPGIGAESTSGAEVEDLADTSRSSSRPPPPINGEEGPSVPPAAVDAAPAPPTPSPRQPISLVPSYPPQPSNSPPATSPAVASRPSRKGAPTPRKEDSDEASSAGCCRCVVS